MVIGTKCGFGCFFLYSQFPRRFSRACSPSPPLLPLTAPFSLLVAPVCCCVCLLLSWTTLLSLLADPLLMLPPRRTSVDTPAATVDPCLRSLSQLLPWSVLSPSCRISRGSLSFYLDPPSTALSLLSLSPLPSTAFPLSC